MELAGTAGHEKHIKMGRRCSFICFLRVNYKGNIKSKGF